ncbi:D-alanyl-D-alanine carboxypeptidase/D-alanyl-D-alanine endopeptidase [Hydrogenophaga soli]
MSVGAVLAAAVGLVVACGWPTAAAWAQPGRSPSLPEPVRQALVKARLPVDALVVAAAPVDPQAPLALRVGADKPVNPASVMKLVTTYAALDLLGPQFVWHTRFWVDGPVTDGLLRGNLYVQGGGDPKFVMERITAALQQVQDAGIRVIHGDLVLDQSLYQVPPVDPSAFDGERLRPYNATPEALLVNFKSVILNFEPSAAEGVARVSFEPPLAGVKVDATVPLSPTACGDWRSALQARFDSPEAIRFAGSFPARCGPQTWPVAYVDPERYAARALEGLWRAGGGLMTGSVRAGTVPASARLVVNAPSLPLSDIVADVNKFSNNVMAQQVFLTLGRVPAQGLDPQGQGIQELSGQGSFERSRARVLQWWKDRWGSRVAAPMLDNGSGLSRHERITAEGLVALLRDAAAHPAAGAVLAQSLPVAGVDGTAKRMGERGILQKALGNAQVKTGTLRDVVAVAGYVQARDGRPWAVAAIVNHPNAGLARPALDAVLEWVASQGR